MVLGQSTTRTILSYTRLRLTRIYMHSIVDCDFICYLTTKWENIHFPGKQSGLDVMYLTCRN